MGLDGKLISITDVLRRTEATGPVTDPSFGQPRFTLGHAQSLARATRRPEPPATGEVVRLKDIGLKTQPSGAYASLGRAERAIAAAKVRAEQEQIVALGQEVIDSFHEVVSGDTALQERIMDNLFRA